MAPDNGIFVDSSKLPSGKNEYVCWIDLMGTSSIMSQSLERATNFILRLQAAILNAKTEKHTVYPMLDGAYVTAESKKDILVLLEKVFSLLATEFLGSENQHRFIPKASLAYGPLVHGRDINEGVNSDIAKNENIRNSILLGLPVIEAHVGEREAPPFGVYIDLSARSFAPPRTKPIPHVWWRWFNNNEQIRKNMGDKIVEYYEWIEKNKYKQTYPKERIDAHKEMAIEYFQ
ncbi:MAG: hypothetical protein D6732_28595 [Methanobacteriota archaeon]|nr:MAG: hypothetical protein D6732_28595 [Euryarchaeota archaeon]